MLEPKPVSPLRVGVVGKGGVGKTSVTAALMRLLTERGLSVLGVDADPTALLGTYLGASIGETAGAIAEDVRSAARLGVVARPRDVIDVEVRRSLKQTAYGDLLTMGRLNGHGCYCSANSALHDTLQDITSAAPGDQAQWSESTGAPLTGADGAASKHYDYDVVLIDCEPGMEIFSRGTMDGTDLLIVVSELTVPGISVAAQIWQTAEELGLGPTCAGKARYVFFNKAPQRFAGRNDLATCGADRGAVGVQWPENIPTAIVSSLKNQQMHPGWLAPQDTEVVWASEQGLSINTLPANSAFLVEVGRLAEYVSAHAAGHLLSNGRGREQHLA